MKLDRFTKKTLAIAMGFASGFFSKKTVAKKVKADRYPKGFNKHQEETRRARQLKPARNATVQRIAKAFMADNGQLMRDLGDE